MDMKKDLDILSDLFKEISFVKDMTNEKVEENDVVEVDDVPEKKIKKNRCPVCNTKLSLVDKIRACHCQKAFCSKHIFPEDHLCEFDYKSHGRQNLRNANPGYKRDKVRGI